MMLHKKSNRTSLLKLLVLVPIVGLALALNARTVTHYVYDEPQKQQPVKKGVKAGTIKMGKQEIKVVEQDDIVTMEGEVEQPQAVGTFTPDDEDNVFDVVDEMPEFPGGARALLEYMGKNVRYPEEAEKQNVQGRVILTFVVGKDGSVRNTKIVKSVDPLLDAEALRVINTMPNWTPGRQNGEPVAVKYTVPVTFRLEGDEKEGNEQQVKNDEGVFYDSTGKVQAIHLGSPADVLFIVDGETVSAEKVKSIDPKTIERMDVLKNKAFIEKYGDQAKDGVVLITTKK